MSLCQSQHGLMSSLQRILRNSVVVETNKDGKEETKKHTIVKNMLFDRTSFERLMQIVQPTPI